MGKKEQQEAVALCGVMHLDAETSLAPVPPLRVVAAEMVLLAKNRCSPASTAHPWAPVQLVQCHNRCRCRHGLWGTSRGTQSYRMVLSVRRRIHWGIGRFCFFALASFCFVRKDLWLCGRS